MLSKLLIIVVGSLPWPAGAATFYSNTTIPTNLTTGCQNALLANITQCDLVVPNFRSGTYYPNTTLARACTASCRSALASFESSIQSGCRGETWNGYDNQTMPVAMIPELLRYHYNMTCLMNGQQYCNNVAAAYAAHLDPNATGSDAPAGGLYGSMTVTNPCDHCLIMNLQFQAGSPYYDGPDIYAGSLYQSKTSSCKVTNMPLTSTALSLFTPTSTSSVAPTCTGVTYAVKSSDTCHTIAKSQNISTAWLLSDNNLSANCANFSTSGTLCLVNKCNIYTVQTNDTCNSIAQAFNITTAQFKAWNPVINQGCFNLANMVGDQLCIGSPGTPYVGPSTTLGAITPTTAAPVPTNVANGTEKYCGKYYKAVLGDYCNKIILKFSISLADFQFLNPGINENCTNLYAEETYCVEAVGDINTYSGRPGYVSYTATLTSLSGDPATRWPTANYTTPTVSTTSTLPLASGTRGDCFAYFDGRAYAAFNLTGRSYTECQIAAAANQVSLNDLSVWNPSLGNATLSNCSFSTALRYCGKYFLGDATIPTVTDSSGSPVRANTTTNCTDYVDVFSGSGWTCQLILSDFDITIAKFYAWNPSVGADCSNLWPGYSYCIAGNGYNPEGTTTTAKSTSVTSTKSSSVTSKSSSVTSTKSTSLTSKSSSITSTKSSSVSSKSTSTTSTKSSSTTSKPSTTSKTSTISKKSSTVSTPSPIQTGMVGNCNKFAMAKSGDTCTSFASGNGITTTQLYTWNTVLGTNGANCANDLWANEWYCVGVSG